MLDRLMLIMKAENLSQTQFADAININRSSVSHIINGRNNPSLDFVTHILDRFPEIRTDWLLFGKGTMYKNGEEKVQDVDLFSYNDQEERKEETEQLNSQILDLKKSIIDSKSEIETLKEERDALQQQLEVLKNKPKEKVEVEQPPIENTAPTLPFPINQGDNIKKVTGIVTIFSDDSFKYYHQSE